MHETLKRAVLELLGPRPTAARYRAVAHQLYTAAVEQERLAAILDEQARRAPGQRITPRKPAAGPGRTPGTFVRIERTVSKGYDDPRLRVYIGRGLWYEWGSPARADVIRAGRHVALLATDRGGYAIVAPAGKMPHISCDGARDLVDLEDGRYVAVVDGAQLTIVGPLD